MRRSKFVATMRAPREAGQAVVELALVMTFLVTLAMGASDFARGVSEYMQVVDAANAAAQYGAASSQTYNNTQGIKDAANANLGSICPGTSCTVTVARQDNDGLGDGSSQVSVTVTVPFHLITPVASYLVSSFNITSTAVMRVNPYNGTSS